MVSRTSRAVFHLLVRTVPYESAHESPRPATSNRRTSCAASSVVPGRDPSGNDTPWRRFGASERRRDRTSCAWCVLVRSRREPAQMETKKRPPAWRHKPRYGCRCSLGGP
jgi:hypothetical protein